MTGQTDRSRFASLGAATVRAATRAADRLLPGPVARWAGRLWCTVPPRPEGGGPGGTPRVPGGSDFEVRTDGRPVQGTVWGDGPVVYLVHGWGGAGDQFAALVEPLLTRGFRVVAFDAPSHGRSGPGPSGPGRAHGVEFVRGLGAVAARFGPAHTVVAHSLGAIVTALALRSGTLATNRLVFIAPLPAVRESLDAFMAQLGLGPRSRAELEDILHIDRAVAIDDFDLARLTPYVRHVPLLVVHDRHDRRTPWSASVDLTQTWPAARLVLTEGLGHSRLLSDVTVVDSVADFIAEPTPPRSVSRRPRGPTDQAPVAA